MDDLCILIRITSAKMNKYGLIVGFLWVLAAHAPTHATEWTYTVRPGDTIWDVVDKYAVNLYYVDKLQQLNDIDNPRRLPIASTLRIPVKWLKREPVSVKIISVSGSAVARRHDLEGETPVQTGDSLRSGDTLMTRDAGNVLLQFADGSRMNVRSASTVAFDTLSQYGDTGMVDTRTRLQRGRVSVKVPALKGAASRYEINTPSATTAVRGTGYRVSVNDTGTISRTEVLEGNVAVFDLNYELSVAAGFGTVAEQGKTAIPTRELLPPPDITALPEVIDRVPVHLAWTAQPGAESYRFQLSANNRFDALMVDRTVVEPSISGIDLTTDDDYFLRIRGRDELGLEGKDQVHRFTLNAFPQAPFPQAPSHQSITRVDKPEFSWSRPIDAEAYLFQLATDESFDSLLVNTEFSGKPGYELREPLEPGRYYWRLATRDGTGELGPASDVQSFRYVPPPPTPEPQPPEIGKDRLVLQWPAGQDGQSYILQMSRDPEFGSMFIDETLEQPGYNMPRPSQGTYYYRIATVDTDGTPSRFSTTQVMEVPFAYTWQSILGTIGVYLLLL